MNKKEALKACYRRGLGGAPYIATGATGSVGAETALELALADGCTFGAGSRGDSYSGGGPPYMAAVAPQAVSASAARPTAKACGARQNGQFWPARMWRRQREQGASGIPV